MNSEKKIEDYLDILQKQIQCKKARKFIAEEIKTHLEDQKEAYILEGISQEEAEEKAILDMGDPVAIGSKLNQIHRPKMNWSLLGIIFIFNLIGLIVQYSLFTLQKDNIKMDFRGFVFISIIGFFLMLSICFFDYSIIGKIPRILWIGISIFFLILPIISSQTINGIPVFIGTSTSIRVLFTLAIPFFGGVIYSFQNKGYLGIISCIFCYSILVIITLSSQSIVIFLGCSILLLISCYLNWFGIKKEKIFGTCFLIFSFLVIGFVILCIASFRTDFIGWWKQIFSPELTERGYGSAIIKESLSHAKWIGETSQLEGWLNLHEYFILTYIICRFGILPGIFVISLFVLIFIKGMSIAFKQKNQLGKFVSLGCILMIGIEGFFYILSNLGFFVIRHSVFPFLSYGKGSILVCYCIMGILLSVFWHSNIIKEIPYINKRKIKIQKEGNKLIIEI